MVKTILLILLAAVAVSCNRGDTGSPTSPTPTPGNVQSTFTADPGTRAGVSAEPSSLPVSPPPLVGTASNSGPRAIGAELQAQSCAGERSLRSISATTATRVEFVNDTSSSKRVYWLSYTGERVHYGTLSPRQSYVQPTFLTHPWVVTDDAGNCGAIFMPTAEPSSAIIQEAHPAPTLAPPLTVAAVAASLAREINTGLDAALRAGLGIASIEPVGRDAFFAWLLRLVLPTPVYAQTFGGFAPCRSGGSVRITGDATPSGRRVSLRGVQVSYSTCSYPLVDPTNNRIVTFSGATSVSGTWTADDADNPVTMSGSLDVNDIGPVSISCTSLSTEAGCNGNVGGIATGPPDTAPPPNPIPPDPGPGTTDGVASVQITSTSSNPRVGQTAIFGATPVGPGGVAVPGISCVFVSSNSAVLALSPDGPGARGVGIAAGTAVVTATCGSKSNSVTIIVRPAQVTFSVTKGGNGNGSLFLNPPGGTYDAGTSVTVTATALSGSIFVGWSGACTGTQATCTLTLTSNQAATGTFQLGAVSITANPNVPRFNVSRSGSSCTWTVTVTPRIAFTVNSGSGDGISGTATVTGALDSVGSSSACNNRQASLNAVIPLTGTSSAMAFNGVIDTPVSGNALRAIFAGSFDGATASGTFQITYGGAGGQGQSEVVNIVAR